MDHRRRCAGGEEGVSHEVHGDEVGDALDQRRAGADQGEEAPCSLAPARVFSSLFHGLGLGFWARALEIGER